MKWLRNVKFECIPTGLLSRWKTARFNHEEWLTWSSWNNKCPNIWNIALYDEANDQFLAFVYGWWDPLDREMRIIRASTHPDFYRVDGKVLEEMLTEIRWYASELRATRVYWETDKWKAFKRKLGDDVITTDAMVLEVA